MCSGCAARTRPQPQRDFWIGPDSTCGETSPRWLPRIRASDTLSTLDLQRADQQWAWWARRVPGGWAGGPYYLASVPGAPTILLRDTTRKEEALAALDRLLPAAARRDPMSRDTIYVRQARWDLAELYDWMAFITSHPGSAGGSGINGWGISNQKNGIMIGIDSVQKLPQVTRWLRGLGVPCRLVVVEVLGTMRLVSAQDR